DLRVDVVSLPHEPRSGLAALPDVHVAGAAAGLACMPLPREPDALTVVDARRHLHLASAPVDDEAAALARVARVLDEHPAAGALRARLRPDELPEHAAGDLLQAPRAVAARASGRRRPRFDAVTAAGRTRHRDLERDTHRAAARRL